MKTFIEHTLQALVNHPEQVVVAEILGRQTIILEVRCHPKDVGRIIGRSGKTIAALRTLVSNYGAQKGCRTVLEVAE